MVFVELRLVGEVEDQLFENVVVEPQITRIDLLKRIETITHVPIEYQQIQLKGETLPMTLEPLSSVADFDVITVKHASLEKWKSYLTTVQKFRDAKENRSRRETAVVAFKEAKQLHNVMFFSSYPTFLAEWLTMREEYATFVDNIPAFIHDAAKTFFTRKFHDKLIEVDFKDKPSGTRSGAMCMVRFEGYQRVFYIKTNHNASSISITQRGPLNLIELYIYKLLEVMNIGAKIDFIPNGVSSDKIVYICGEEIPGFRTLAMLEKDWENFERKMVKQKDEISKALIQVSLLVQVLGLGDLNAENVGFIENTSSVYVVDFRTGFIDSSIGFEGINRPKTSMSLVAQLKMNLGRFSDFVKKATFEEQLEIGKEFMVRSQVCLKLDEALEKLNDDKEVFRRSDLSFNKGTEALIEYITVVREKISQIQCS